MLYQAQKHIYRAGHIYILSLVCCTLQIAQVWQPAEANPQPNKMQQTVTHADVLIWVSKTLLLTHGIEQVIN